MTVDQEAAAAAIDTARYYEAMAADSGGAPAEQRELGMPWGRRSTVTPKPLQML